MELSDGVQDPCVFDEAAYTAQLLEKRQNRESVVFTAAYSLDGEYLVCGTNQGKINVWHLPKYLVMKAIFQSRTD